MSDEYNELLVEDEEEVVETPSEEEDFDDIDFSDIFGTPEDETEEQEEAEVE